jgi:hypothetical protein
MMEIREQASKRAAHQSEVLGELFPDDRICAASIVTDQEIARMESYCKDEFLSKLLQNRLFELLEVTFLSSSS